MRGFEILLLSLLTIAPALVVAKPWFKELGPTQWSIGNDLWSIEIGQFYGVKLYYQKRELVDKAKGFYAGYGISPSILLSS
jgi:hypothetical protein